MTSIVYEESCCCGSKIVITMEMGSHFERKDRINEFVRKHRKCAEIWATTFVSMPTAVSSRAIDPDETHLTQEERDEHGKRAKYLPAEQLVMSFSDVDALLYNRAAKNRR